MSQMQENPFAVTALEECRRPFETAPQSGGRLSGPIALSLTVFLGASLSTLLMFVTFIPIVLALHMVLGEEYGPGNYGQFGLVLFAVLPFAALSGASSCLLLARRPIGWIAYVAAVASSIAVVEDVWPIITDNVACSAAFVGNVTISAILHFQLVRALRRSVQASNPRHEPNGQKLN